MLEALNLTPHTWNVIMVLQKSRCGAIAPLFKPGGMLAVNTFQRTPPVNRHDYNSVYISNHYYLCDV